jgi:uncharacterized protein (TIGR03435 family)
MNSAVQLVFAEILVTLFAAQGRAQSITAARPEFEAATVKPSQSGGKAGIRATPGRLVLESLPLRVLITVAYKIRPSLISGGPSWLDSTLFDIQGKADSPLGADPMFLMLQTLLENRFQLKYHREIKEGPVYELTIAKGDHRLKPPTCIPYDPNHLPPQTIAAETPVRYCGRIGLGGDGTHRTLDAEGVGMVDSAGLVMQSLTGQLANLLDRPVIDKTGLTGTFDFHLEWTPDQTTAPSDDSAGPSIFTALQQQLGLKLEAARGPVEFLVIDRVEKPSGN